MLAPWLGIAAARLERARPEPSVIAAWASSSAASALLLAGLFAGSALRAALGPCHPFDAAGFFPLLAFPSALAGCAVASALAFAVRGRRAAAAGLYAGAVLLLVAWRLAAAYRGPQAFLLDPLLGYFPGPLYDEAVPLDARLLAARGEALGWAAAVAGAAALAGALVRRRGGGTARLRGPAALAAAGLLLVSGGWAGRAALQGGLNLRAAIADRLGARRDGPRCTLFLPAEKPPAAAAELLAECEFHAADVAARLAVANPPHVTVYLYRSAEEKRRLVGASHTDFTRPWQAEIHLLDQPLPHPVLRHENRARGGLGPFARPPARPGPLSRPPLAGAGGRAGGGPRVAPRRLHRSPVVAGSPGSRVPARPRAHPGAGRVLPSQAPARAYTAAGSFLAYLLQRYGAGPVGAAYRTGDLASATGEAASRAGARVASGARRGSAAGGPGRGGGALVRPGQPVPAPLRARGGRPAARRGPRGGPGAHRRGVQPVRPRGP